MARIFIPSCPSVHRKGYECVEVKFHRFLMSSLGGDEWSASNSGYVTPILVKYIACGIRIRF
jgi:hypothetical protein